MLVSEDNDVSDISNSGEFQMLSEDKDGNFDEKMQEKQEDESVFESYYKKLSTGIDEVDINISTLARFGSEVQCSLNTDDEDGMNGDSETQKDVLRINESLEVQEDVHTKDGAVKDHDNVHNSNGKQETVTEVQKRKRNLEVMDDAYKRYKNLKIKDDEFKRNLETQDERLEQNRNPKCQNNANQLNYFVRVEQIFDDLVKENKCLNTASLVIDAQFEFILQSNQIDSDQVEKLAEEYDVNYKYEEYIGHGQMHGRFTVFGGDLDAREQGVIIEDFDQFMDPLISDADMDLLLDEPEMINYGKRKSIPTLPPIPEETDTASDDGLYKYSSNTMVSPMSCGLIRYTSTPHLNVRGRRTLEDSNSSDESPANKLGKSDSGFEDQSFCFVVAPPAEDALDGAEHEKEKLNKTKDEMEKLVEANLEAFLTFTGFPVEYKPMIIERFMKSGMAIL
jgi:hypothetical protein